MRFRPWPKPEPYRDTSRKRAAFILMDEQRFTREDRTSRSSRSGPCPL